VTWRSSTGLAALSFSVLVTAAPLDAQPLFSRQAPATADDPAPEASHAPAVVRERAAAARTDLLIRGDGSPAVGIGERIELNLFDDAVFSMRVSDVTRHAGGGHTWAGTLDGVGLGHAVLAAHDGTLVGQVVMPGAVYRIGHAPDGRAVIMEIDQSRARPEAEPRVPPRVPGDEAMKLGGQGLDVAGDSAAQIDVMVVYTAAARAAAGGTSAMLAEVNLAVAAANQAYANNGLVQRIRLVLASEVPHVEDPQGSTGQDLAALQADPVIGWLRDAARADLVSMLIYKPTSPFCGTAFLMTQNSGAFAPLAFSVADRDPVCFLTFVHELGHTMGADHDTVASPDPGLFAYSHGYFDHVGVFRTIMALTPGCPPCTRIPYFSTPGQTFNGRTMGDAATADNERTLSQSAGTVANFRRALTPPPTLATSANKTSFAVGDTMMLTAGIDSPGLPGVTVDAYLGLMSTDGTALFFTALPVTPATAVVGDIRSVASYRPFATAVPLDAALSGTLTNFVTYRRTGAEPTGGLVLFFLLVTTTALADGGLNPAEVVAVSLAPFTFLP
jgi:hypothetical protein